MHLFLQHGDRLRESHGICPETGGICEWARHKLGVALIAMRRAKSLKSEPRLVVSLSAARYIFYHM